MLQPRARHSLRCIRLQRNLRAGVATRASDTLTEAAIRYALKSPANILSNTFNQARCSGSDCKWDLYRSLAICRQCTNISDRITALQQKGGPSQYIMLTQTFTTRLSPDELYTIASLPNGESILPAVLSLSADDFMNRTNVLALGRTTYTCGV